MTDIRTKLIPLVSIFLFVLSSSCIFSQTFNFVLPDELVVCQSDDFQILINNNTGSTLSNIELEINLPCRIEYLTGTIQGGITTNVSDLTNPIFRLSDIGVGESVNVSMRLFASCANILCIDNGDQFLNEIRLTSNQGIVEFNTPLYNLETALPVITKIENPIISGVKGQTVERIITIKNTRPGLLDTLIFSDLYQDGLTITSDLGEDISTSNGLFEIRLTGSDFSRFGDEDDFFDFNEEIIIKETILIDACGFHISAVRSELDVAWGCNGNICSSPIEAQTALVDLDFTIKEGPILEFQPQVGQPLCLCDSKPTQQSMIINNVDDNHSASSIVITIISVQFDNSGIPAVPVQLKTSTGTTLLQAVFSEDVNMNCENPESEFYSEMLVTIPEILPGEEVELIWDVYFCTNLPCFEDLYQFNYNFRYRKDCTLNSDDYYSGSDLARADLPYVLETNIDSESAFEYLNIATIDYMVSSPLFLDNEGSLDIQLDFPCHLEVLEEDWLFNDISPLSINVVEDDGITIVNLSYPLPLDFTSGIIEIDVQFVCNDKCQQELCKESFITSCPGICDSDAFIFSINSEAQLNFDECLDQCLITSCTFQIYFYDCELPYCEFLIPGYLISDFNLYRLNRGLPDNDNDHFPDNSGELDESKIRLDRAITGDTLRMEITGEIIIDIPGESFTKGLLDVNMKQLKTEGINPNFQQLEFIRLINSEVGLITLKKELRIVDASSGLSYICEDVPLLESTGVGERSFDIDIERLIESGCNIPVDYKYEHGDSIYFVADFFIRYNFNSLLLNYGSMDIEFLNINTMYEGDLGAREDLFACGCPTKRIQFANYKTAVTSTATNIDICEGFGEGGEFKVLKYGTFTDFFPYEYKPPLQLNNLLMPRVEGVELVSARLVSLKSNGEIFLVDINDPSSYIDLDFSETIVDTIAFTLVEDIIGYYLINPTKGLNVSWDENLEFRIEYEYQNQGCLFFGSQDYNGLQDIDYSEGIKQTNFLRDVEHGVTLLGKQAVINTNISLCDVTSLSDELTWELDLIASIFNNDLLSNSIYNVWFYPESKNGALSEFKLYNKDTGLAYEEINGIFQLDSIADADTIILRLTALSSSCEREEVIFNFGWSCEPHIDSTETQCFERIRTCFGEAPPGVIDMIAADQLIEADLCDTLGFTEVYIFNAGLGPLNQLIFEMDLPPGLTIADGTSQIEYPNGSMNYFTISDPQFNAQGNPFWILDNEISVLQTNGLSGVTTSPENGFTLRFKSITNCDFISGSRIIYNIDVQRSCGEKGNTVSKFSAPLRIKDIPPPYSAQLSIDADLNNGCEDLLDVNVQFSSDELTGSFDDILIQIPEGLTYVLNSCSGNLTDCQPEGDSTLLIWSLPEGQTQIQFSFQLAGILDLDCEEQILLGNSTIEINANCVSDGSDCFLRVSTAEVILPLKIERPIFDFLSMNISVPESNVSEAQVTIELINISNVDATAIQLSLYLDLDNSGTFTEGDQFIGDYLFQENIQASQVEQFIISNLNLSMDELCQILVVIEEDKNCVCSPAELFLPNPIEIYSETIMAICSGDSIQIGVIGETDHLYEWDSNENILCPTCPSTIFSAVNSEFESVEYVLTLNEIADTGCALRRIFKVTVNPQPGIWSEDKEICLGEEVFLLASNAESYEWSGEGIIDPSLQLQTVSPMATSAYTVIVIDSLGCSAMDTVIVVVNDIPMANAGNDILACYGQEVSLSVQNQDSSYFYFWTPGSPFLDDPTSASPTVLISQAQEYILEVSDDRCEAYDTLMIDFYDGLNIASPDTLFACYGDAISINLMEGISYTWSPSFTSMCQNDDCSDVLFTPENSLTLMVVGESEDMCQDTSLIDIIVIDPDDPSTTELMICEGDEIEIFNELISTAGIYCDTTLNLDGCANVECIDLSFFDVQNLNITVSDSIITPGSEVQLTATSGFEIYSWVESPNLSCLDCPDPMAVLLETETFILIATDQNGCTASDEITIVVRDECDVEDVLIPNAFTANANNKNDRFRIANTLNREINVTIEIYSRWGELLYSENGNSGWDGTYNLEAAPEGVYLYIIRVDCGDGNDKFYKGNVTLFR